VSFGQNFSGGNGTQGNPYLIATAADLAQLATYVNAGNTAYNDKHYKLANNINLSAYGSGFNNGKGWIPIGKYDPVNAANCYPFKGIFDGDSNKITGLYINDTALLTGAGLFGSIVEKGVCNLIVDSVNIRAAFYVGSVAGYISIGGLWQCSSSGNIAGWQHVGGLAGHLETNGFVLDCYSSCNVSGLNATSDYIGGIAGWVENMCKITNCYSTGNISGRDFVGGVVGWLSFNSFVSHCYSTGNVTGNQNVGGVAGSVVGSSLINSYSTSNVVGSRYVGGIAGNVADALACLKGAIIDCIALNLSVIGDSYVGRVIGRNSSGSTINNSAYDSLLNKASNINWNNKEADQLDGKDITKEAINEDGTLSNRFTDTVWTTQNGKLPGLFGKVVNMPPHLRIGGGGEETGIATTTNYELRVYPNPNTGQLTIEGVKANNDLPIQIFNVVGQDVGTGSARPDNKGGQTPPQQDGTITIDVSHLANGMYFLKIGNKTVRFVKE
jgi:hypothetical protein